MIVNIFSQYKNKKSFLKTFFTVRNKKSFCANTSSALTLWIISYNICHMNRMKQIFLYFSLMLMLSNCAGTTQGWLNQHEWLNSNVRKGDRPGDVCTICGEDWVQLRLLVQHYE